METPDRPDGALPARPLAPLPAGLPRATWDDHFDGTAPPAKTVSARMVWKAARRHWWQILALWAVVSAGLCTAAYMRIKPTYESTAWLKVDNSSRGVLAAAHDSDLTTSLETQVQLITSPDVLIAASHDPRVAGLPRIRNAIDLETELRSELRVATVPRTQLIQVGMVSENPTEAAAVINAVIDAYRKASVSWSDHEIQVKATQLKEMKTKLEADSNRLRDTIRKLTQKSVQMRVDGGRDTNLVSVDSYLQFKNELGSLEIQRLNAESELRVKQETYRQGPRVRPRRSAPQGAALDAAVERAFKADPEVARVLDRMEEAQRKLKNASRIARSGSDRAVQIHQESYDKESGRYKDLWAQKRAVIRDSLVNDIPDEEAQGNADIEAAQMDVRVLKDRQEKLAAKLQQLEVDTKNEGGDVLELRFAEADRTFTEGMLETVDRNLQQIEYETHGGARVDQISIARPTFKPLTNKRTAMMAAAPVGTLVLVLALFVLIEAKAGRVGDPDDLPSRVRVGVIGVVPPLPVASPGRGIRRVRDEKRQVEEFVQSLDHLRVTLCAGQAQAGGPGRRCILITSACGGEGKTTLAAQLAGRCANAGLLTLLVDGDLRRPSLGELLEVPEGPGLVDVLLGDAEPEAAMVVIGSAGGFHLLPAGSPGHDPSRLLQGDRLGQLVAQFRATFDIVIIDAPPVLAVPDALLLGRWVDGAVLAVRHDTSRFPLVERANRRLAAIGIPVLGAVVNGVRTVESGYGAYHYAGADRDEA